MSNATRQDQYVDSHKPVKVTVLVKPRQTTMTTESQDLPSSN